MKHTFIYLTALLIIACNVAQAQDANTEKVRSKVRFGIQVSPELVWLKPQDKGIEPGGSQFGFSFGPMLDFKLGDNYAIGTGLNIVNSKAKLQYTTPIVKFNTFKDDTFFTGTVVTYKMRFVEIPVLLKLSTNEIGYMRYYAFFGFVPGFEIGAKGTIQDGAGLTNKVDEDMGKDVTPINLSLQVGAGFSYSLTTTTSLYVSLSFVNGFTDITDNPKEFKTKAVLNRVPLSVGIYF